MQENGLIEYKPIKFQVRKKLSDSKMILKSERFLSEMSLRHTIRDFSDKKVPFNVIKNCIKVACSAPSGANHQPWHFTAISNQLIKSEIRRAAENEEKKFYNNIKNDEWLKALEPLGTNPNKPHLEKAPWLVIVFSERYGISKTGKKYKNYYVPESVGIATGFLIASLHKAGLSVLTHTPNPMSFLTKLCGRPESNKPVMILTVGHASSEATVPKVAKIKKPIEKILTVMN